MRAETNFDQVDDMTMAFGQPLSKYINSSLDLLKLRRKLITEEYLELMAEFDEAEMQLESTGSVSEATETNMLKEAVDLLVVTYGLGVTYGWAMNHAFREVIRSNMSKLDKEGKVIYREDGKVLKGPYYIPADVRKFI